MNFVTVTGDEPVIVATVAANIAAMAALDSGAPCSWTRS
jgi:hypothetical protein